MIWVGNSGDPPFLASEPVQLVPILGRIDRTLQGAYGGRVVTRQNIVVYPRNSYM